MYSREFNSIVNEFNKSSIKFTTRYWTFLKQNIFYNWNRRALIFFFKFVTKFPSHPIMFWITKYLMNKRVNKLTIFYFIQKLWKIKLTFRSIIFRKFKIWFWKEVGTYNLVKIHYIHNIWNTITLECHVIIFPNEYYSLSSLSIFLSS